MTDAHTPEYDSPYLKDGIVFQIMFKDLRSGMGRLIKQGMHALDLHMKDKSIAQGTHTCRFVYNIHQNRFTAALVEKSEALKTTDEKLSPDYSQSSTNITPFIYSTEKVEKDTLDMMGPQLTIGFDLFESYDFENVADLELTPKDDGTFTSKVVGHIKAIDR